MSIVKYSFIFTFFCVFICCKSEVENTKSWKFVVSSDGSSPVPRHEAAFIRVKTKFYLLGGRDIKPVSIFDAETQVWSQGAKPPIELHHFQPVVYNNKIYIVGAMTGKWPTETPASHVYIYDPLDDLWKKGDEIPKKRRRGSTGNIIHNNKIYVSCGIKNGHIGDYKNWLDSYNLQTGTWQTLADAPRARDHFQAVLVNNNIYAIAGRNSTAPSNPFGNTIGAIDVYNISSNTWTTLHHSLPTKRAGNAAIFYNDQVFILGGESDTQEFAHNEVDILDIKTDTWKKGAPLKEGRHGSGVLAYEKKLFIASGCGKRGGEPELLTMENYTQN